MGVILATIYMNIYLILAPPPTIPPDSEHIILIANKLYWKKKCSISLSHCNVIPDGATVAGLKHVKYNLFSST